MILLTNIKVYTSIVPTYKSKMPKDAVIINPNEFDKKLIDAAALNPELAKKLIPLSAIEPNKHCDQVPVIIASDMTLYYLVGVFTVCNTGLSR